MSTGNKIVICVNSDFNNTVTKKGRPKMVFKGNVYEVIDEGKDEFGEWYELSIQPYVLYPKSAFEPYVKPKPPKIKRKFFDFLNGLSIIFKKSTT